MKLARFEDLELRVVNSVREGRLTYYGYFTGAEGSLANFVFALVPTDSDYKTPRHRHNFDQIRFQLTGEFDYSRDGVQTEGSVGYFPEGTFYGPATAAEAGLYLILQIGGASGSGYMSKRQHQEAVAKLKKVGEVSEGIYTTRLPDGTKKSRDSYEAVWEEVFQRKAKYPAPRYDKPIFMRPENFNWVPMKNAPGISRKSMGVFGERELRIAFFKAEPNSALTLPDASLYYVVKGSGTVRGQHWHAKSAIHVEQGEQVDLRADEPTELLHIGLPDLVALERETASRDETVNV